MGHISYVAIVGYVVLFATCAIFDDLRPAFLAAAAVCILSLLAGIVFLSRVRIGLKLAIPKANEHDSEPRAVRIGHSEISLRPYLQVATCAVSPCRVLELAACAVLAIGTIVVLGSGVASYRTLLTDWGLFELEVIVIAGLIVLLACLRWAHERWVLRRSHALLGPITGKQNSLRIQQLRYEFFVDGNRFGGFARTFGETPDNVVVVFYRPDNPDENQAHCSLIFHRLSIVAVNALRVATESKGAQVNE